MNKVLVDVLSYSGLFVIISFLIGIIYKLFVFVVKREFEKLFKKLKEIDTNTQKIEKIDDRLDKVETIQQQIVNNLKEKLNVILIIFYSVLVVMPSLV